MAGVTAAATSARMRRLTSAGRNASPSTISRPTHVGVRRSGLPRMTLSIALASISGPDISRSLVGVGWTSCNVGDAAPTTTTRPRTRAGSTRPLTRSENETVSMVPGGPWKSIHAPPFGNEERAGGCPSEPRGHGGQRRQPAVLVLDALQDPAAALGQVARRRLRTDALERRGPAEHVGAAVLVGLRRGQHDVVRAVDRRRSGRCRRVPSSAR